MRFLVAAVSAAALLATLLGGVASTTATAHAAAPVAAARAVHGSVHASVHASVHDRPGSAALDSADAWYFCRSEVYRFASGIRPGADPFRINSYSARFIQARPHHRWKVQLVGALGQGVEAGRVNAAWCIVGGTVGRPKVISYLYPR